MLRTVLGLLVVLLLISAIAFVFTRPAQAPGSKDGDSAFKVALITPGRINDGGWSESAFRGLKRIEQQLGATVKNAVAVATDAFDQARTYADAGFDVVVCHASEMFDENLIRIAQAHPKTQFLVSGSDHDAVKGVCGLRFALEDATYVLGYLAAEISKSKIIGCVGPVKIPVIESTFEAFVAGARAAHPEIDVRVVWVNSWDDIARAKELTLALIGEKVDLVFHNANDCAKGIFQAVQESNGVYAFGANDDQTAMAEDVILANAVLDIPKVLVDAATAIKAGHFDSQTRTYGMAEGYVRITYNEKLKDRIPDSLKVRLNELVSEIQNEKRQVPRKALK